MFLAHFGLLKSQLRARVSSGNPQKHIGTLKALRTGKARKAFGVSISTTTKGFAMFNENDFDADYVQWLTEEDEIKDGWDSLTQQLSEDEDWARALYDAFHGQEV